MKVLITGHRGYIGSALFEHLRNMFQVVGVDCADSCNWDITKERTVEFVKAYDPDVIINCAGISGKQMARDAAGWRVREVNARAAVRLRLACPAATFVQLGSCSCFDPGWVEDTYADSKYRAEMLLRANQAGGGLVLLRLGTVYGYNALRMRWDLPLHRMVRDGLKGLISIPDRRMDRPWVKLENVCKFIEQVCFAKADDYYFNPATATPVPLVDCNVLLEEAAEQVRDTIARRYRDRGAQIKILRRKEETDLRSYSVPAYGEDLDAKALNLLVEMGGE